MILRELVTRLGFQVDKSQAKRAENAIGGMMSRLTKLASFFGVAIGLKEMSQFGSVTERAAYNLKRFTGTDFGPLQKSFKQIQAQINGIRKGAGDVALGSDFNQAGADFFMDFGKGQSQMQAFTDLWRMAAKQSAITGKNVREIMDSYSNLIKTGDFSAVLDLPGFDMKRKNLLEFTDKATNANDPAGVSAIRNRISVLERIMTQVSPQQDKLLRMLDDKLLQKDQTNKKLQETMQRLGDLLNRLLTVALPPLVDGLTKLTHWIDERDKPSKKIDAKNLPVVSQGIVGLWRLMNGDGKKSEPKLPSQTGWVGKFFGEKDKPGTQVSITNTFHIEHPDGDVIAKKAADHIQRQINTAHIQIKSTETR